MSGIDRKNEGNAGRRLCTVRHCRSESVGKVENQLEPRGLFQGPIRQARLLAEGQKSAEVKHNWAFPPPFRQLRQLAERVEFPEKKAAVCQFRASFGGVGHISREKCRFLTTAPLMLVDAQDVGEYFITFSSFPAPVPISPSLAYPRPRFIPCTPPTPTP